MKTISQQTVAAILDKAEFEENLGLRVKPKFDSDLKPKVGAGEAEWFLVLKNHKDDSRKRVITLEAEDQMTGNRMVVLEEELDLRVVLPDDVLVTPKAIFTPCYGDELSAWLDALLWTLLKDHTSVNAEYDKRRKVILFHIVINHVDFVSTQPQDNLAWAFGYN